MKICVTQRNGTRYFSRFTNIGERDRLELELTVEDKNGKTINIDLTSALINEYAKHPEVGEINPDAVREISALEPLQTVTVKKSVQVKPAYLTESQKEKDKILAKVRKAQLQAVEERKERKAEIAARRAKALEKARKAKAEKEADSKKTTRKPSGSAKTAKSKSTSSKPAPAARNRSNKTPAKKPSAAKADFTKLTKTQKEAIKKVGKVLAKEEKAAKASASPKKPIAKAGTSRKPTSKKKA